MVEYVVCECIERIKKEIKHLGIVKGETAITKNSTNLNVLMLTKLGYLLTKVDLKKTI